MVLWARAGLQTHVCVIIVKVKWRGHVRVFDRDVAITLLEHCEIITTEGMFSFLNLIPW